MPLTVVEKGIKFTRKVGNDVTHFLPETIASQVKLTDGTTVQSKMDVLVAYMAGDTKCYVVDDNVARDALADLKPGDQVWSLDASSDTEVAAGAALYIWDGDKFDKIAEAESMDVVLEWANLQNKPASTVADIDAAVTAKHVHANAEQLAKFSEADGKPMYDGKTIGDIVVIENLTDAEPDGLYFVTGAITTV